MLPTIESLFRTLDAAGVSYCHWKSNWALPRTLMGETDLDLLVGRADARRFREILTDLGFEPSMETGGHGTPSTEHHMTLDEATGTIVHVHAYYRVITGESLSKNYHLPLEEMLLTNTRRQGRVNVPVVGAELIVFVVRMLVKHTTAIELTLLMRQWKDVRREVDWLMTQDALEEARKLLPIWLPNVDEGLFREGYDALKHPAAVWRRVLLGYRFRRRLRSFRRRHVVRARAVGIAKFTGVVSHRLIGSTRKLSPGGGGAVIAFVGSEATGKSTILSTVEAWLAERYTVRRVHAGKPPATGLTSVPHVLLPAARWLLPDQRFTRVEAQQAADAARTEAPAPLMFAIRSVMLAYERRALLVRAFAHSSDGAIVLCDRYPSSRNGAPDSPQLAQRSAPDQLRRRLAALETRLYEDIRPPDLVIHLTAPLDVTLARNAVRGKVEPEDHVRRRHGLSSDLEFEGARVRRISTDRPLEDVIREVKDEVWQTL